MMIPLDSQLLSGVRAFPPIHTCHLHACTHMCLAPSSWPLPAVPAVLSPRGLVHGKCHLFLIGTFHKASSFIRQMSCGWPNTVSCICLDFLGTK